MRKNFETSVHALMEVACDCLESVAKPMGQVGLVDDRFSGYDGWDRIADSIFEEVVAESIRWSLKESEHEEFKLLKYAFRYEEREEFSFIRVRRENEISSSMLAFTEFTSKNGNYKFDHVIARNVQDLNIFSGEVVIPLEEVRYSLIRVVDGIPTEVETVRIVE
ncbi:MAG: hypothetical protein KF767_04660 [Bdellovibrionaceae bacterium]|nr:hypothetical protein [Pseudobdellovibrionaceae bacterium]